MNILCLFEHLIKLGFLRLGACGPGSLNIGEWINYFSFWRCHLLRLIP